MATSKLIFYKVEFDADVLPYVDDLSDYLLGLRDAYTVDDFQYIRNDLSIEVKLNLSQEYVNKFDYNYCKIKNSDEDQVFYYYIDKVPKQINENTIIIPMSMDTVNTLGQGNTSLCNPRNFTAETEITREHQDRFKKPMIWNPLSGGILNRKIDKESEGLIPDKVKIRETRYDGDGLDWYLIYKNQNNPDPEHPEASNPVRIFLCANEPIIISKEGGGPSESISASDLTEGQYHYALGDDNISASITAPCDIQYSGRGHSFAYRTFTIGGEVCEVHEVLDSLGGTAGYQEVIYKLKNFKFVNIENDRIGIFMDTEFVRNGDYHANTLTPHNVTFDGYVTKRIDRFSPWDSASGVSGYNITLEQLDITRTTYDGNIPYKYAQQTITDTYYWGVGPELTRSVNAIDVIDRTDSKLIKIIKYPYCPIPYSISDDVYNFGDTWLYSEGLMAYRYNGLPQLGFNDVVEMRLDELKLQVNPSDIGYSKDKYVERESKLYHSDFYTNKLVYDSFYKDIKLERVNNAVTSTAPQPIPIDFKPTGTINSKFGFKINMPNATVGTYERDQDFDEILLVTRNNEETILNNEYINYIKTGYNYDKKANALQIENAQRNATVSTTTTVISTLGAIASFVAAAFTGGATIPMGVALATGAISSGINTANQFANIDKTQEAQQNAMQSKLAQLAAQSTSTSGTDDVDLMSWYSNNKLWLMKYQPDDYMRNRIYKKLDYTGYAHNAYEAPNVDSRIWYNYIQCTPRINFEGTKQYKTSWLNDLKQKYQQGVTVFHHNMPSDVDFYDFGREHENWETWIVEGVN